MNLNRFPFSLEQIGGVVAAIIAAIAMLVGVTTSSDSGISIGKTDFEYSVSAEEKLTNGVKAKGYTIDEDATGMAITYNRTTDPMIQVMVKNDLARNGGKVIEVYSYPDLSEDAADQLLARLPQGTGKAGVDAGLAANGMIRMAIVYF